MAHTITWLANTWLSSHMRDVKWLWPTCETLHFIGLSLLIGGAGLFDLRLMGFMRRVPVSAVRDFMPYAIVGFVLNLVTGVAFFVMMPAQYAYSLTWYAKLLFIVIAGLNAMLFETTLGTRVLTLGPEEDTPTSFKVVGAVSLFSWFAVLYCGRMLPYLGTGN
ncbi:MAG TPA: hypothetical protein VKB36_24190 [Vicinamibacterales bacterium]|nr:hypothetical protein [Vicinamibacterales bacterium]